MPTKIEWAEETWNPVTGCTKISEGCKNCYAERMSKRLAGRYGYPKDDPFKPGTWHYDKIDINLFVPGKSVFVCSMGDLFHEAVNIRGEDMRELFRCMASHDNTFLVLTKRPKRMKECIEYFYGDDFAEQMPHVLLGVTAENKQRAEERISVLRQIPAAVRFVSFEPLLSDIDPLKCGAISWGPCGGGGESGPVEYDGHANIDWAIVGAETGPGKRHMKIKWAQNIRDWCVEFRIPFFFKKDSNGNHELDGEVYEQFPISNGLSPGEGEP